jgi:hypothetical protein
VCSLGTPAEYLSGGVLAFHVTGSTSGDFLLPYAAGSIQIAKWARVGVEIFAPTALDSNPLGFGSLLAVVWGVRIFNDNLWGDIALLDPMCDGCGAVYSIVPVGIPFISVGFRL